MDVGNPTAGGPLQGTPSVGAFGEDCPVAVDRGEEPMSEGLVNFSEYVRVMRRRKLFIVLGLVLGLLAGYTLATIKGNSYSATAQVEVKPVTVDVASNGLTASTNSVDINTEIQVAQSATVADLVIQKLKLRNLTAADLLAQLTVQQINTGNVLEFQYTTNSAAAAQAITEAVAEQYLQWRATQAHATIKQLVQGLQTRVNGLQSQLVSVQATLASAPRGSTAANSANAMEALLSAQISPLRTRLDDLNTLIVDPGTVIVPAVLPTSPSGFTLPLLLLAGGFIGLLVGVLVAFARDFTDKRVRDVADIERYLSLPVVATFALPRTTSRDGGSARGCDSSPLFLSYAAGLLTQPEVSQPRTLVVAPADDSGSSAIVAVGLACALTESGASVAMVASDEALAGIGDVAGRMRLVSLAALTRGSVLPRPEQARTLIGGLREAADFVLIAAQPLGDNADSLVLAAVADAVLLVAVAKVTSRAGVTASANRLRQVHGHLEGVMLLTGWRHRSVAAALTKRRERTSTDVPVDSVSLVQSQ